MFNQLCHLLFNMQILNENIAIEVFFRHRFCEKLDEVPAKNAHFRGTRGELHTRIKDTVRRQPPPEHSVRTVSEGSLRRHRSEIVVDSEKFMPR